MVHHVRPEWSVRESTAIEAGTDTVYHLTVDTGEEQRRCILKVCTEVPPPDFRPEPYILSALAERTSVPGPRPLGSVEEHDDLPAPFYLMEHCEGVTADEADLDPEGVERVARAAGRHAGEYHQVGDFRRFGRVRLDCDHAREHGGLHVDGRTVAAGEQGQETWRAWVEALYNHWITDLEDRFADLRPEIEQFVEARLDLLDGSFEPVLGHIDYKPWNVMVRPATGETTALIDWGHANVMTAEYDLLLTEEHLSKWAPLDSPFRRRIRTAIEEGYTETNELHRDAAFDARRELYLLVSRLQPLVWISEWMAEESPFLREEKAAKHRAVVENLLR
jgi:aminoglycoside phosphotransferase (APT) family kinase protein